MTDTLQAGFPGRDILPMHVEHPSRGSVSFPTATTGLQLLETLQHGRESWSTRSTIQTVFDPAHQH
jgi:hypothetical protein